MILSVLFGFFKITLNGSVQYFYIWIFKIKKIELEQKKIELEQKKIESNQIFIQFRFGFGHS